MNSLRHYWPLLLIIALFSCKSRKKFAAPVAVNTNKDSIVAGETVTAEKLLTTTLKDWTFFSSKASVEYIAGDNNRKVGSNIRMYRDSLIWISVNEFGIEGARILISKDSMVFYDKIHRNYMVYNKELVESVLGAPLTVSEIQNVILAKPIYALKLYDIVNNGDVFLRIRNQQPKVFVNHTYQKQYYTIDTTLIEDKTAPHYARVNYSDFANINDHNFPLKSKISAYNGASTVQINMEFENPDFVSVVTFPFTIPSSYERIK